MTAGALVRLVGVLQPTLSKWLRDAGTLAAMESDKKKGERRSPASRKRTVREKPRAAVAADELEGGPLNEILRRDGVHEPQLKAWRETAAGSLPSAEAALSRTLTARQGRSLAGAEGPDKANEDGHRRRNRQ